MAVRITGVREAIAKHVQWAERARSLRPVLVEGARDAEGVIDAAWSAERSPAGATWPPKRDELRPGRDRSRGRARRQRGRGLDSAHEVTAAESSIRIRVPVRWASFQFFGTEDVPARNPLPIERGRGGFVIPRTGAAGEWLARALTRIKDHLVGRSRGGRS